MTVFIRGRQFSSKPCLCFPSSMLYPNLFGIFWIVHQSHCFIHTSHHFGPWWHLRSFTWPWRHHHILALPPHNVTLTCIFWPIYHTLSIMEWDAYEESNLRTTLCPTLLKLHLETPVWAYPWQWLQRLFAFTATPLGIFVSTVLSMNAPTASNTPQATPNTAVCTTTVLLPVLRPCPHYCPDRLCTLCNDPGHVITNCPFSEDPSSDVIFNNGDPEGI